MCKWFKKNKYMYMTECGLTIYLTEKEMVEIIYCRKCGKKVEII